MMKTIKETLELALEVLITINNAIYVNSQQEADAFYKANDAITALRVALASQGEALTSVPDWASEAIEQPAQQEPVAWAFLNGQYAHIVWGKQRPDDEIHTIPLYTSPPAQQRHISYVCPQCYWSLDEQPAKQQEPVKLWLWKNFVNGRPEYWAFDNAFPVNLNNDDPQVIGEPCGYAWLKPSRQGRFDVSDEEVLRSVQNAKESPPAQRTWVGLTDEDKAEIKKQANYNWETTTGEYASKVQALTEAKLKAKNSL